MSSKTSKRGRPLKGAEPLNTSITIRLSERERENLLTWCWRFDESPSDVIRDALRLLAVTGL